MDWNKLISEAFHGKPPGKDSDVSPDLIRSLLTKHYMETEETEIKE